MFIAKAISGWRGIDLVFLYAICPFWVVATGTSILPTTDYGILALQSWPHGGRHFLGCGDNVAVSHFRQHAHIHRKPTKLLSGSATSRARRPLELRGLNPGKPIRHA